MELYGSLLNISGSVTASTFTGSFIGDGSGLSGIQASGVTGLNLSQISNGDATASISTTGFNVNKNTQIQGNLSVTGALIANEYIVSSSVIYMTTSFASGSSAFGNDNNDVHQFTGSVQITGSISLNGQAIGTGKLDETTFQSYTSSNDSRVSALETSSGSLNSFTSSINTTIKSKLDSDNVISGSVQVNITGTTGYNTFSSSISSSIGEISSSIATTTNNLSTSIATTDLNQTNRLISIETKTGSYATTGSNLFIGTQTLSGSIIPAIDNAYDLGSPTYQWRDVYISSGSLYIDGTKVLSSTAQELTITTDNGQSIKILEGTTDSIVLQVADGDIELKSSADGDILLDPTYGKIMLKGPVEILTGQKIQSSVGGTPVVFANDIVVSGSIDLTGTIDGIDLTAFSSSVSTRIGNLETSTGSLNEFTSSTNSRLTSIETSTGSINSYTSSNNTRLGIIETTTGSLNTYTSSNTTNINDIHTSTGSLNSYTSSNTTNINAIHTSTGSLNSYTSSNTTNINAINTATSSLNSYTSSNNERLSTIETSTGSLNSYTSSNNTKLGIIEGTTGSLNTFTSSANTRLVSIENKTGSYATTGSNIFQGTQIITGSLFISQDLIIAGSSSIQNISSSVLNISDNIITVNAVNPSVRFGGLAVIDSGSSPQVSGSMLFDSVKDEWLFVHQNQGAVTSSVLLMGPETFNNIGNEAYITQNRLTKGSGVEHLNDSNITDTGTKVSINSNTEITGTFVVTGTALVSGSSQISHDSTTGYVANRHIDHSEVTITAGNGLSGGGTIEANRTMSLDTSSSTFISGVKSKMNTDGVISGSSQVVASLPSGTVSGSSQVLSGTGIFSGSAQLPSGLVSGSSQVLGGTTIHSGSFFNGITVVSGSGQISFNGITDKPALVSGSGQISFNGIADKPALVSGSSQITFGSISGIPGGIVSGSVQVDLTSTTNYSSGIKTRLNAEGVLSGSVQVVAALPSGTVSGSAQITLSSTTGYGSVINQAVLTTSSPTFAGITNNGTYTQATTSTQPLTINGDSGDTNGLFRIQMDSVSDSFASGARTYLGDGGIDIFLGTSNSSYTPSNTYIALNHSGEISMGAGSANKHFTLSTSGNLTISGTIGASNLSGTNTGDQTLNSLGALSSNSDSEQDVGGKNFRFNDGSKRINMDPRWNEPSYDADLGILHIYGTTAGGVNYGRAGIALYNDSAYQYITTKNGQNNIYINNNVALHAGNYTSYAMAGAGYSANQNLSTTSTVTFGNLRVGSGGSTNGGVLNVTGGNDNQVNITHDSSWGLLLGYCNEASASGYHGPNHAAIINVRNASLHFGINNSSNVQISSGGHFHPSANNTYDCGTSSLAWRNVYTNDLHLSNMNKPEGNDVDGTNGNWTIQEGAENLYIINNNNGKKFKISLEEII
jgi:hypothetical protein